ncbi:hypothetical protein D3C85_473910 [compost metagenome]
MGRLGVAVDAIDAGAAGYVVAAGIDAFVAQFLHLRVGGAFTQGGLGVRSHLLRLDLDAITGIVGGLFLARLLQAFVAGFLQQLDLVIVGARLARLGDLGVQAHSRLFRGLRGLDDIGDASAGFRQRAGALAADQFDTQSGEHHGGGTRRAAALFGFVPGAFGGVDDAADRLLLGLLAGLVDGRQFRVEDAGVELFRGRPGEGGQTLQGAHGAILDALACRRRGGVVSGEGQCLPQGGGAVLDALPLVLQHLACFIPHAPMHGALARFRHRGRRGGDRLLAGDHPAQCAADSGGIAVDQYTAVMAGGRQAVDQHPVMAVQQADVARAQRGAGHDVAAGIALDFLEQVVLAVHRGAACFDVR